MFAIKVNVHYLYIFRMYVEVREESNVNNVKCHIFTSNFDSLFLRDAITIDISKSFYFLSKWAWRSGPR